MVCMLYLGTMVTKDSLTAFATPRPFLDHLPTLKFRDQSNNVPHITLSFLVYSI
jgi:hypothetical protein